MSLVSSDQLQIGGSVGLSIADILFASATVNLSQSGMLLRTHTPLPVGTEVDIQFLFPGDPVRSKASLPGGYGFVEGRAVVVRHTHPMKEKIKGMGLHFVGLEERGRQMLADFLEKQQRRNGHAGTAPQMA